MQRKRPTRLLMTLPPASVTYHLYQVDEHTLYAPGADAWLSFTQLQLGRFMQLNWQATSLQSTGKRLAEVRNGKQTNKDK